MSENKSGVCPKCGGTSGYYTKGEVWQYYKSNGDPDGYDFVDEGTMAICLDCGRRTKLVVITDEENKSNNSEVKSNKPFEEAAKHICRLGEVSEVMVDTLREFETRIAAHFGTYTDKDMVKVSDVFKLIDRITQEMLEGKNEQR